MSHRQKTYLLRLASSKDSNQPAHPRIVMRMKTICNRGYPKCAHCDQTAHAQSDQNFLWAHMAEDTLSDVATHIILNYMYIRV